MIKERRRFGKAELEIRASREPAMPRALHGVPVVSHASFPFPLCDSQRAGAPSSVAASASG